MSSNWRKYLILSGASAASQALMIVIAPLLTRLYTPEDFGKFASVMAWAGLLCTLGTGRLEHAIPVAKSRLEAIRIYSLSFASLGFICIITGLVAIPFCLFFLDNQYLSMVLTVPFCAFASGIIQLQPAILLRHKKFQEVASNRLLQGVFTGCVQAVAGAVGLSVGGLVIGQAAGYFSSAFFGSKIILKKLYLARRRFGFHFFETLKTFKSFPINLTPAAFCNHAAQQAPLIGFAAAFGMAEAGVYALTIRVIGGPLTIIGKAVSQVFAAEFRELKAKGLGNVKLSVRGIMLQMLLIGVPAIGFATFVLIFWSEKLFGAEWKSVGTVTLYLTPVLITAFMTGPIGPTLTYIHRKGWQLIWDSLRFVLFTGYFVGLLYRDISFELSIWEFACISAIMYLVNILLIEISCQSEK